MPYHLYLVSSDTSWYFPMIFWSQLETQSQALAMKFRTYIVIINKLGHKIRNTFIDVIRMLLIEAQFIISNSKQNYLHSSVKKTRTKSNLRWDVDETSGD